MKLTSEQTAIVKSSGNIKINAVAGSGKTTKLIAYAQERKEKINFITNRYPNYATGFTFCAANDFLFSK